MTRDEKNRKIAEWLQPRPVSHPRGLGRIIGGWWFTDEIDEHGMVGWQPRDFFTDEAANALVLEKMPLPTVERRHYGLWACLPTSRRDFFEVATDRKTAISEACLQLIEKPKEPSE